MADSHKANVVGKAAAVAVTVAAAQCDAEELQHMTPTMCAPRVAATHEPRVARECDKKDDDDNANNSDDDDDNVDRTDADTRAHSACVVASPRTTAAVHDDDDGDDDGDDDKCGSVKLPFHEWTLASPSSSLLSFMSNNNNNSNSNNAAATAVPLLHTSLSRTSHHRRRASPSSNGAAAAAAHDAATAPMNMTLWPCRGDAYDAAIKTAGNYAAPSCDNVQTSAQPTHSFSRRTNGGDGAAGKAMSVALRTLYSSKPSSSDGAHDDKDDDNVSHDGRRGDGGHYACCSSSPHDRSCGGKSYGNDNTHKQQQQQQRQQQQQQHGQEKEERNRSNRSSGGGKGRGRRAGMASMDDILHAASSVRGLRLSWIMTIIVSLMALVLALLLTQLSFSTKTTLEEYGIELADVASLSLARQSELAMSELSKMLQLLATHPLAHTAAAVAASEAVSEAGSNDGRSAEIEQIVCAQLYRAALTLAVYNATGLHGQLRCGGTSRRPDVPAPPSLPYNAHATAVAARDATMPPTVMLVRYTDTSLIAYTVLDGGAPHNSTGSGTTTTTPTVVVAIVLEAQTVGRVLFGGNEVQTDARALVREHGALVLPHWNDATRDVALHSRTDDSLTFAIDTDSPLARRMRALYESICTASSPYVWNYVASDTNTSSAASSSSSPSSTRTDAVTPLMTSLPPFPVPFIERHNDWGLVSRVALCGVMCMQGDDDASTTRTAQAQREAAAVAEGAVTLQQQPQSPPPPPQPQPQSQQCARSSPSSVLFVVETNMRTNQRARVMVAVAAISVSAVLIFVIIVMLTYLSVTVPVYFLRLCLLRTVGLHSTLSPMQQRMIRWTRRFWLGDVSALIRAIRILSLCYRLNKKYVPQHVLRHRAAELVATRGAALFDEDAYIDSAVEDSHDETDDTDDDNDSVDDDNDEVEHDPYAEGERSSNNKSSNNSNDNNNNSNNVGTDGGRDDDGVDVTVVDVGGGGAALVVVDDGGVVNDGGVLPSRVLSERNEDKEDTEDESRSMHRRRTSAARGVHTSRRDEAQLDGGREVDNASDDKRTRRSGSAAVVRRATTTAMMMSTTTALGHCHDVRRGASSSSSSSLQRATFASLSASASPSSSAAVAAAAAAPLSSASSSTRTRTAATASAVALATGATLLKSSTRWCEKSHTADGAEAEGNACAFVRAAGDAHGNDGDGDGGEGDGSTCMNASVSVRVSGSPYTTTTMLHHHSNNNNKSSGSTATATATGAAAGAGGGAAVTTTTAVAGMGVASDVMALTRASDLDASLIRSTTALDPVVAAVAAIDHRGSSSHSGSASGGVPYTLSTTRAAQRGKANMTAATAVVAASLPHVVPSLRQRSSPLDAMRVRRDDESTLLQVRFGDLSSAYVARDDVATRQHYQLLRVVLQRIRHRKGAVFHCSGDGVAAAWNAFDSCPRHVELAARCAQDIANALACLRADGLHVGIVLHQGVFVCGTLEVGKDAFVTAFGEAPRQLCALAELAAMQNLYHVLVTEPVKQSLSSHYECNIVDVVVRDEQASPRQSLQQQLRLSALLSSSPSSSSPTTTTRQRQQQLQYVCLRQQQLQQQRQQQHNHPLILFELGGARGARATSSSTHSAFAVAYAKAFSHFRSHRFDEVLRGVAAMRAAGLCEDSQTTTHNEGLLARLELLCHYYAARPGELPMPYHRVFPRWHDYEWTALNAALASAAAAATAEANSSGSAASAASDGDSACGRKDGGGDDGVVAHARGGGSASSSSSTPRATPSLLSPTAMTATAAAAAATDVMGAVTRTRSDVAGTDALAGAEDGEQGRCGRPQHAADEPLSPQHRHHPHHHAQRHAHSYHAPHVTSHEPPLQHDAAVALRTLHADAHMYYVRHPPYRSASHNVDDIASFHRELHAKMRGMGSATTTPLAARDVKADTQQQQQQQQQQQSLDARGDASCTTQATPTSSPMVHENTLRYTAQTPLTATALSSAASPMLQLPETRYAQLQQEQQERQQRRQQRQQQQNASAHDVCATDDDEANAAAATTAAAVAAAAAATAAAAAAAAATAAAEAASNTAAAAPTTVRNTSVASFVSDLGFTLRERQQSLLAHSLAFSLCDDGGTTTTTTTTTQDTHKGSGYRRGCATAATLPSELMAKNGTLYLRSDRLLGRGSFGCVYLGMDSLSGKLVAIKYLPLPADEVEMSGIEAEVMIMQRVKDAHVVEFITYAFQNDMIVFVMECMMAGSLQRIICEFRAIPSPTARVFTRDVLRGLATLHAMDVIHRDVKPQNVLLSLAGNCKISDFGASALVQQLAQKEYEGNVTGTPAYLAPEAAQGKPVKESDIWSCGVMFLQMLMGKLPYTTEQLQRTPAELVYQIGAGIAVPTVPDNLDELDAEFVHSCLQTDPRQRKTAQELLCLPLFAL